MPLCLCNWAIVCTSPTVELDQELMHFTYTLEVRKFSFQVLILQWSL